MESPIQNVHFLKINKTAKALSLEFTMKQPIGETVGVMYKSDLLWLMKSYTIRATALTNPCLYIEMDSWKRLWNLV